jgi:hypothetical protein
MPVEYTVSNEIIMSMIAVVLLVTLLVSVAIRVYIKANTIGKVSRAKTPSLDNHEERKRKNARHAFFGLARCRVDERRPSKTSVKPMTTHTTNGFDDGSTIFPVRLRAT